jgi:hypothetical protein
MLILYKKRYKNDIKYKYYYILWSFNVIDAFIILKIEKI